MFGFIRKPKRYESPSEYTPPSAEELASEYVFERKKPDVPDAFNDKVRKERERLEGEETIGDFIRKNK